MHPVGQWPGVYDGSVIDWGLWLRFAASGLIASFAMMLWLVLRVRRQQKVGYFWLVVYLALSVVLALTATGIAVSKSLPN